MTAIRTNISPRDAAREARSLSACKSSLEKARMDLGFLNAFPKLSHLINEAIKEADRQSSGADEYSQMFI